MDNNNEKLTPQELEDFIISLTPKQKELLQMSIALPYLSGNSQATLVAAQNYGMDRNELGGRIGTLMKRKTDKGPLLRVINRDEKGRKQYSFNERIADREEANRVLEKLLQL